MFQKPKNYSSNKRLNNSKRNVYSHVVRLFYLIYGTTNIPLILCVACKPSIKREKNNNYNYMIRIFSRKDKRETKLLRSPWKTNDENIDFDKSSTPAAYKLMTITITEKNEWNNAGKTVPTKGTINKTIV